MGETLRDEVTTVLKMLDEWAADHGDEGVFYRCRQRLREALQREDDDEAEAESLVSEDTTSRLMNHARSIMTRQDAAPPADAAEGVRLDPSNFIGDELPAVHFIKRLLSGVGDEEYVRLQLWGGDMMAPKGKFIALSVPDLRTLLAAAEKAGPGPATRRMAAVFRDATAHLPSLDRTRITIVVERDGSRRSEVEMPERYVAEFLGEVGR